MTKTKMYRYLGRNGIITSPILLDKAEHIEMYALKADEDKVLYNGEKYVSQALCFADELGDWVEVDKLD
jgi:hypothetical protein